MTIDAFLDRPRSRVSTSAGEIELPALYRDASALFAFIRVPYRRAADALEDTPLVPVRLGRDAALLSIGAFDYRDTSIGPYRELGVAIAAIPRAIAAPVAPLVRLLRAPARADAAWRLLDLPVTSTIADVGGRELWGFPKFVTAIDVEVAPDHLRAVVRAPQGGEDILTLEGRSSWGVTLRALEMAFYTTLDGRLLRTFVETRGRMHTGLGRGLTLRVGRGEHPMARRLAALGVDGARPMLVQSCPHLQLVLNAGAPAEEAVAQAA